MSKSPRAATLVALLMALPLALGAAAPLPAPQAVSTAESASDISDAELVYRLARIAGHDVTWPAVPAAPATAELPLLVIRLGERAGAPVAVEDAMAFAELDPAVAAPVAHLLVAVEMAWDLRDQAFVELDAEEQVELWHLVQDERVNEPRYMELHDQIHPVPLIEGAILLVDTLEGVVLPQLLALKDAPVWPEQAVADPVGVLRIGGTGDDVERRNRIVQVDARGEDRYENNAGATTVAADLDPATPDFPVSAHVDLSGSDLYAYGGSVLSQGAGAFGIGLLLDISGSDQYQCRTYCQGADHYGVGILREFAGDGTYEGASRRLGGARLLAFLRDDDGDDTYRAGAWSGGYGDGPYSVGLLWDRSGTDSYATDGSAYYRYGWGADAGHGWLIDDGSTTDYYQTQDAQDARFRHGCNNCTWTIGSGFAGRPVHGHGVDNHGGLAYLLAAYEHV